MSNRHEAFWREVQFDPQHWDQVPESAGLWAADEPDDGTERRLLLAEEMGLVLRAILVSVLTPRQRQVLEMYFLEARTQVEIAQFLGIAQSTVAQHLSGKRRGSRRVGGAFAKIRKGIHKSAVRHMRANTRYARIIQAMDELLDRSLTHRRARNLLEALAMPGRANGDHG